MTHTLTTHTFHGTEPGSKLLVFGAIHGDEVCGPNGINSVIASIAEGLIKITKGQVTFVPVCNPIAYEAKTRLINVNLNRVMNRHAEPTLPEHHFANQLCDLIETHDVLLDLHSYSIGDVPFLFLDTNDQAHHDFAAALPYDYWLTGWPELYADKPELNAGDTVQYALAHDKTAILVECGHHHNPNGGKLAETTIMGALSHFGLCQHHMPQQNTPHILHMERIVVNIDDAQILSRDWRHLDPISKGQPLTLHRSDSSVAMTAPFDGYMVMPNTTVPIGEEWFYLAK